MPKIYDKTDFLWTFQGDLSIDNTGDIADTQYDPLRSCVQEIRTRIKSEQGDWSLYPELGASLRDFIGKFNNKTTAESIKTRIISALTQHGFIGPRDIKITYIPVTKDRLMVRINMKVMPTARNVGSTNLAITFIYSYSENNVLYN